MCGIAGFYNYDNGALAPEARLHAMLDSIVHRGPDDHGVLVDRDLAIGMRRLSIIDVAGGHQPIFTEDGAIGVVFNGEIYNFPELQARLKAKGHVFKTNSDTEVIAHLYEELGEKCVDELRGMFGFAVWDSRKRRLFIARDRLGIKPLYYTEHNGALIFGSEIKTILRHPGVPRVMNASAMRNYLALKYVPAPQTMFEGIVALPPGHAMIVDERGIRTWQYWDFSFAQANDTRSYKSEREYTEELSRLLREVIKMHLISDVPFGAFLSGGVDSSTIVALMSEVLNEPVKTFSVGFAGKGEAQYSELPFARMVAERYKTDHHEVLITPTDLEQLTEKVVWHIDQPIADQATLANYMVAKLAATKVKMVLTGEGGDELFAGYARYSGERFSAMFHTLPGPVRAAALGAMKRIPGMRRGKLALFAMSEPDAVRRMVNWFPLFNRAQLDALITDQLERSANGYTPDAAFAEQLARTDAKHPLNRMLYVDTKLWLPDDLLARGDKTAMAVSLEGRVPLLDHKLVEFAASLPIDMKIRGMTRKYLLRKVAEPLLPDVILNRPKQGFPVPIALWFRNENKAFVHDLLAPDTIKRRGILEPAAVAQLLSEHDSGFADHSTKIWGLLNIELWHRLYMDGGSLPTFDSARQTPVAEVA
jgi:asparagine synthase (glutamine-hydrolysing)